MENLVEKYADAINSSKFAELTESQKGQMGILLENAAVEAKKLISEGTLSGDITTFTNILLPLVRRTQPNLIANALTSVIPLAGPTGYIYSMKQNYVGSTDLGITPTSQGQIIFVGQGEASDIVVGATITSGAKSATVIYKESTGGVDKILINTSSVFVAGDVIAVGGTDTATVTAAYSNEAAFTRVLQNYAGVYSTAQGEALSTDMNEMGISIHRKMLEVGTQKCKAKYTMEMFQDLQAVHGLNAENELMNLMSYELQAETDRRVVDFVNGTATAVADVAIKDYAGRWEIEKYRSLALKIEAESREIARLTRRGPANTLVVSPKVAVMLKALGGFELAPVRNNLDSQSIASVIGTFEGKTVVVDNFATGEYVTAMYKGQGGDAPIYYAPYVGGTFVKTMDYTSGQPAVILMSRYALDTNPLDPQNYIRNFAVTMDGTALA